MSEMINLRVTKEEYYELSTDVCPEKQQSVCGGMTCDECNHEIVFKQYQAQAEEHIKELEREAYDDGFCKGKVHGFMEGRSPGTILTVTSNTAESKS